MENSITGRSERSGPDVVASFAVTAATIYSPEVVSNKTVRRAGLSLTVEIALPDEKYGPDCMTVGAVTG